MAQFGIGQAVRRLEDPILLAGQGNFLDDVELARQAHAVVLRSPVAHARIRSIDTSAAEQSPGVLAVYTGADIEADDSVQHLDVPGAGAVAPAPIVVPPRRLLVSDTVRYVGDYVAFVVAESVAQARDAADLIMVDYEELPAVTDLEATLEDGAPRIWDDAPGNLSCTWTKGDKDGVDAAFANAHHITKVRLINNRVVVNSLETRGAIGDFDPGMGKYTLYATTQGTNLTRTWVAPALKVPLSDLRVITSDVGGGFGMKMMAYPEYVLVCWAARQLGRPVKWVGDRSDAFLSDAHARDHITTVELALDENAKFLGVRADTVANMGGCLSPLAPMIPTVAGSNLYTGLYIMPAVSVKVRLAFTNTVPVDAYRGAGRPEVAYAVERVVDAAARDMGITPDEIRRRNFVPNEALPYETCMGEKIDSGDFVAVMQASIDRADWAGADGRKKSAREHRKLRGIGMATYVEACGGGADELAELRVDADGRVTVLVGSQRNGQGHLTAYAQIINETMGLDPARVRLVQGDTDLIPYGRGTGYSRSIPVGGSAVKGAAMKVVERSKKIAAHLLETSVADIEVKDGKYTVAGTDRSVSFEEIAAQAYTQGALPEELGFGIAERHEFDPPGLTYPNGCHIAEIEIDQDTGAIEVVNYTIADDLGMVINPLLLAGQVHGGCAQGIGQALLERTVYDHDSGQLVTGSYMDYTMPRADDLPYFDFQYHEIPCQNNALGMKGAGEAGAIGSPPAIINAIVDALSDFGVSHVDMPATREKVWRIIHNGGTA
jgi:carbon-monoxide dehydrogenase large subunit